MKRNVNIVTRIVHSDLHVHHNSNPSRVLYRELVHIIKLNFMTVTWQSIGKLITCSLLLFAVLLGTTDAIAQDSEKKTHFLIEPYFMAPAMKGEIGVRQLPPSEVDADAGDIFGQLKFGAMLYMEANFNNKWSITTDFLYMNLEADVKPNALVTEGTTSAKQLAFEFAGLKRIAPWFEAGVGGRVISLKAGLDLSTINGDQSGSKSQTWVDPIIIVRSQGTVHEKWLLQFRGDLGGFGIASDFTWQIQANVGYQFSKLFHAAIGYRMLDVDYDKGEDSERFMYDIVTSGPVVRMGFSF